MSVLLLVCGVAGYAAQAEDYPTRSVKLITQGAAASGPDVVARIVAEPLGRLWGQQVVILNHPGAGGSVAARQAASAAADGYTLYMPATSAFVRPSATAWMIPASRKIRACAALSSASRTRRARRLSSCSVILCGVYRGLPSRRPT